MGRVFSVRVVRMLPDKSLLKFQVIWAACQSAALFVVGCRLSARLSEFERLHSLPRFFLWGSLLKGRAPAFLQVGSFPPKRKKGPPRKNRTY